MASAFWWGTAIVSISAIFNGTFALPMKYFRTWRWENMWLAFCLLSRLFFGVLAVALVPHLWQVYSSTPTRILMVPAAFGLLLGIGQVTYGLGIASVGTSVAIAVVSGVSCVSGAFVPLLVLSPADLFHARGILLLLSMPVLIVGLVLLSMAGRRREQENTDTGGMQRPLGFVAGLAVCISTGVLGSSVNLGFAFGGGIVHSSLALGGNAFNSTYAVWAILFATSFLPNLIYCAYFLSRKHSWPVFFDPGGAKELALAAGMAVLSSAAFVGYGIGTVVLGKYGTSVGWAAFVAATIIASAFGGLAMGEWKNTTQKTRRLLFSALVVILLSVGVLDLGGVF
jgi:L-rhamnose-H+ transport protein